MQNTLKHKQVLFVWVFRICDFCTKASMKVVSLSKSITSQRCFWDRNSFPLANSNISSSRYVDDDDDVDVRLKVVISPRLHAWSTPTLTTNLITLMLSKRFVFCRDVHRKFILQNEAPADHHQHPNANFRLISQVSQKRLLRLTIE